MNKKTLGFYSSDIENETDELTSMINECLSEINISNERKTRLNKGFNIIICAIQNYHLECMQIIESLEEQVRAKIQ